MQETKVPTQACQVRTKGRARMTTFKRPRKACWLYRAMWEHERKDDNA